MSRSLRSQFFLTGPRPCPYLPDRRERKLFTNLVGGRAEALHDDLAQLGFRRSQNIAYRPACQGCSACVSTRVPVRDFTPTRSQKRVAKRNADLIRVATAPSPRMEHYQLFQRYLQARHAGGGMVDMDMFDFAAMVEDSPVRTHLIEYRAPKADQTPQGAAEIAATPNEERAPRLTTIDDAIACCVTDVLRDGLSLVYSFFEPAQERRSLGRFIILDHIEFARSLNLDYVYLGYWVRGSRKMDYKIEFQPSEVLEENKWVRFQNTE
ncbi:MAG: arginyltransferase [Pseudomonadota bacterium]